MIKRSVFLSAMAIALIALPVSTVLFAKGGSSGGSVKPVTTRIAGNISFMQPVNGGVAVTIGTSYYATGTALVNKDTKIRVNGVSQEFATADVRLGDFAEIDAIIATRVAYKLEVVGRR